MALTSTRPPLLSYEEYQNIIYCNNTTESDKNIYLNAISNCGFDNIAAEVAHNTLRIGRLRKGPRPNDIEPDEGLGILMSEIHFVRKTAPVFGMSIADFDTQYRDWISYHDKRHRGLTPTDSERLATFGFLTSHVPARQDGEIWLFRSRTRSADPFEGANLKTLANDLGLALKKNEARLTFVFKAAHVDGIAVPRFYDPHWVDLSRWHWSGRTKPLNGAGDGFEEVVAQPPCLRDLTRPVVRLIVT
jgi:hypothetical protein